MLISAYGAVLLAVGGALTSLFLPAIGRWLLVAASVSSWRALAAIKENAKLRAGLGAHLVPACLCALFSLALTGVCAALWLFGMASGEPS